MNIILSPGTPHMPQIFGGLEMNTHELALELNRRGHDTWVLCKLGLCDAFGAARYLRNRLLKADLSVDSKLGYHVYRSRRPATAIDGLPMPNLVVVKNGPMIEMADTFARRGVPTVAYLYGLGFENDKGGWGTRSSDLPFRAVIALSEFTAARFKARFGIDSYVIPPVFRPDRYIGDGDRRYVTFINPVPVKGVEVALALAALCPEIPFRFVRGWPLNPQELVKLKRRIRQCPNVELVGNSTDMRPIYGATRILLVPSQWEAETWGRVASEAQFSGVPVLASNRGGLPESVGPGGTVIEHDAPAEVWATELRRLWHDKAYYAEKSEAALVYSQRPALDFDYQVETFLSILRRAA